MCRTLTYWGVGRCHLSLAAVHTVAHPQGLNFNFLMTNVEHVPVCI